MSESNQLSLETFKRGLLGAADCMCSSRDELCALDARAGDGDLGSTMATGFSHVREIVEGFEGDDLGALLKQVGVCLGRKAPSTIGALLASAFIRVGAMLEGVSSLGSSDIAAMLQAATDAVAERGKVATGMRTIVDAMDGGAVAAANAARLGVDPAVVFREAANGARAGAEATAGMEPRVGRAGWIKDRARGIEDAGAVAWALFLEAFAEAVAGADQPLAATLDHGSHGG